MVIGSGFGGLAAAVRLAAQGHAVRLLEALDQPGGRARVFRQDGFTFDAGPTVITAPYLFEELFATANRRMADYAQLMPVDPFYRILFPDGHQFDFVGEEERLLAQIAAFNPRDVDGYRRLAAAAKAIFDVGYTQLADQPFDRLSTMLRVVPSMLALRSHESVWQFVARHIKDERLRQVFTFEPLLVGGSPLRASSIYLLIHWLERKWGVHYVRGGTGALVLAITRLLAELGVPIHYGEPVEKIDVRHGRVLGVSTARGYYPCDIVVANADPSMVYANMLPRAHRPPRRLTSSMSLFVAYFGTSRTHPEIAHHTIVMGDNYRTQLRDVFVRRVMPKDLSVYIHAPTRSDPRMAPSGQEAFYALVPVPNSTSGVGWNSEQREEVFGRIIDAVEARMLPGLGASLVTKRFLTPQEFAGDLRSTDGAAFGPEPLLRQSAYFRYHNRSKIEGLYFVGAGTHPGAGVPGVLNSAKLVARMIA